MTMETSSNASQKSKLRLPIMIGAFVIVIALVFYFVFEGTKNDITIVKAGEVTKISTHAKTVGEVLNDEGVKIGKHDELSYSKNAAVKDGMKIAYIPAKEVTINDEGKEASVWTTKDTVAEVLKDENITTRPQDALNVSLDDKVSANMEVKIDRAVALAIQNGAKKETTWSTKDTVAELLTEKKIKLDTHDKVLPAKTTKLTPNMTVVVTYVDKKTDEKKSTVAFKTVVKEDSSLKKGEEKVVQTGKAGEKVAKYDVVLENGKEKHRKLLAEQVIAKPEDKIVVRGTKEEPVVAAISNSPAPSSSKKATTSNASSKSSSASTVSSKPSSGGKTFTMESTAYSGGGTTATGINLTANPGLKVVAVDPSVIPLGSRVYVSGYGEAIAGDTGGAIKGNIVDVYFADESQCYTWGRRQVTVTILD
ncbi:ubiquitin-like domain-containing protein [Listeria rocourtiae]|uniref:ubiquitin-like domain-containing protein n=1 Tax=Listeria rocourtiae TaxID=647910 RepID=UPI003D2F8F13